MTFNAATTAQEVAAGHSFAGRRVVITGASAGIGAETARVLGAIGAQLVLLVRDPASCAELSREIVAAGGLQPQVEALDLADLSSVRAAAAKVAGPVHTLINNAGVMATPFGHTRDGFETQIGVNHLGHFLLTHELLPALKAGAPARVVVLSSAAHVWTNVDLDDINWEGRPYDPWLAYGASKTANILFAVELNRQFAHQGIVANAVHPGRVGGTKLSRSIEPEWSSTLPAISKAPIDDPSDPAAALPKNLAQGAATTVWAALDPQFAQRGGNYLYDCRIGPLWREDDPRRGVRPYALDPERAKRLWEISERLVGVAAAD
jgi:NAD(P)-dependent dehydrogenase (short-subunit alcohol dehydrogenase family)